MPKIPLSYYNHRKAIGNHTKWQDSQQLTQQQLDDHIERLAKTPGLHSGNVHRQTTALAMVQLLAMLSSVQISNAKFTETAPKERMNTPPEQKYNKFAGNFSIDSTTSQDLVGSGYMAAQAFIDSKNISMHNFMNHTKIGSHLSKRSLDRQENISYKISALISDARFDSRLRNALDSIFKLAVSSPEILSTPKEDQNLFILFKCIQQMHFFIKKNSLLENGQELMTALFKIVDGLDNPRDKTFAKIFKKKFFSEDTLFNTKEMSDSSMYNITEIKNFAKDVKLFSSDDLADVIFAEQTRHISRLLEKNQFKAYKAQSFNRINNLIEYLSLDSNQEGLSKVARLLLSPMGLYGSSLGEPISEDRKMAVIAAYINHAIFGMSLEKWIVKQAKMIILSEGIFFTNTNLLFRLNDKINYLAYQKKFSQKAQTFYINTVLKKLLPTLSLQLPVSEQRELAELVITKPKWGFIHAGALFLNSRKVGLNGMNLADIEDSGMMLYNMINQGVAPPEYAEYFRLPALFHHEVYKYKHKNVSITDEQNMPEIYVSYFNYLNKFMRDNDPIEQLSILTRDWKTRPALAQKQLNIHNLDLINLNLYLNYHAAKFAGVSLPNVDQVFEEQNLKLANMAYEVDKLLLAQVFNSLDEADQKFIEQSKVDRVRIQFNAQDSIKKVPLPPAAMMGLIQSSGLNFHIPDHIDLLACTLKGEERIYALEILNGDKYTLNRVDRDRQALLWLLDDSSVPRADPEYQIRVNSHLTLKEATEAPQKFIEKLAEIHKKKLLKVLYDQGYNKTTLEKIDDFLLGLIPLYTCINESKNGNAQEAITACIMDAFSLIPVAGKAVQVGTRFSTALGGVTSMAVRYGAQQATIKGILQETSEQLIYHAPFVAQEVSPKVMQGLSVNLLRDVDPGFGLLASGGTKGIRVMKNIISKISNNSRGVAKLSEALMQEKALLSVSKDKNLKIESIFCPAQGKNLAVIQVGNNDGQKIWAQINRKTNEIFGQKFILNAKGNLEQVNIGLRHQRRFDKEKGKNDNSKGGRVVADNKDEKILEDKVYMLRSEVYKGERTLLARHIGGSHFIQYHTKTPGKPKPSETLVVTAHGGYVSEDRIEEGLKFASDKMAPPVVLPPDLTIKLLNPHGTVLIDPKLKNLVNAGANVKAYVTITNGEIKNIDYVSQEGNPTWLADNFDPKNMYNVYGRLDGLQNYRLTYYENDTPWGITLALKENRELAARGEAVLSDILAVDEKIIGRANSSLQKSSIQTIIDLDKKGRLLNEIGERYKTIVLAHCRTCYEPPHEQRPMYFTSQQQLKEFLADEAAGIRRQSKKSAISESALSEVTLTKLSRKNVNQEFQIEHYKIGRLVFIYLQQNITSASPSSSKAGPSTLT